MDEFRGDLLRLCKEIVKDQEIKGHYRVVFDYWSPKPAILKNVTSESVNEILNCIEGFDIEIAVEEIKEYKIRQNSSDEWKDNKSDAYKSFIENIVEENISKAFVPLYENKYKPSRSFHTTVESECGIKIWGDWHPLWTTVQTYGDYSEPNHIFDYEKLNFDDIVVHKTCKLYIKFVVISFFKGIENID